MLTMDRRRAMMRLMLSAVWGSELREMRVYQRLSRIVTRYEPFTEEKLAQIAGAAMAAIEDAWQSMGHTKRKLEDACERLVKAGGLESRLAARATS